MAVQVVVTYRTKSGRKMSRDMLDHTFAGVLTAARRLADRPGVSEVKVWNQMGQLLASPKPSSAREG